MLFVRPDLPATDACALDPEVAWEARKGELIEQDAELAREIARLQGAQVAVRAALMWEGAVHAGPADTALDHELRSLRADLALRLRSSEDFCAARLDEASDLFTRLPRTLAALQAGDIDLYKAGIVRDQTMNLTVEQCHQIERGLVPRAAHLNPAGLRRATRRAVERMDKDATTKRAKAAEKERGVWLREAGDGMYDLHAHLPAVEAISIYGVVDTLAHATKKCLEAGDERSIANLRADALYDLVVRPNGEQRVGYEIGVVVPAGTLLGLDDADGYLPGHGPIPAALCRELAADNAWRRILTDPTTGHVLDLSASRYAPSDRLAAFVRTRDQHCRWPGCRGRIDHSEIDHTVEFAIGGQTIRINLSLLCRRHHRIKHLEGWDLIQHTDGSGTLTFLTPTGQMFRTRPPDPFTGEDPDPEDLTPRRAAIPDVPPF
ncbi:MAG: DUF222 domain-containing protein [Sporichthyaceae bacterium]